jgi:hypothetical protein
MKSRSNERKSDLRNASVLEIIVAIIIVLVILLHSNNIDFGDQIDELVQQIDSLRKENSALIKELSEQKSQNAEMQEDITALREKIIFYENMLSSEKDAAEIIEKLAAENARLEAIKDSLVEKIGILESQLAIAIKKLKDEGKSGIDKPFCRLPVLDDQQRQKHKWLGQISSGEGGIYFSVDPKLDKTEAFKIPGVRMLVLGSPLNNQEFIRAARLAFSHSKQRDPECRYNVQIKVGPNEPASFILLIEKYFYKSII